jgi:1-aminocyclopropane-1-carboxylate deaminase
LIEIKDAFLQKHGISLWIKRDDLLHPVISGNKWRKLKYNLVGVIASGAHAVKSMGGAYSNYLHALAYAGKQLGLATTGIIRGERPPVLNPTLEDIAEWGMTLNFVSRTEYRRYRHYATAADLPCIKPGEYWLPEGGSTPLALQGIRELVAEIDIRFDILCVPCGTGATLSGLIDACPEGVEVLGFSALKSADALEQTIRQRSWSALVGWRLIHDYHFGGFAKITPGLLGFMRAFEESTATPLEPVYNGKMFYGLYDMIRQGYFKRGSRIIAVHTGGLQGNRGFDR